DTSMDTEDGQNETAPHEGTNEAATKESHEADTGEANSSVEQIPMDTNDSNHIDSPPKSNNPEKRDQTILQEKSEETPREEEKKSESPRIEQDVSTTTPVSSSENKTASISGSETQENVQPSVSRNSEPEKGSERASPAEPQKSKTFVSEQAKPQVVEKEKSPVKEESPGKSSLSDSWGDHSYSRPCTPVERPTVAESRLEDLGVETQTQEEGRLLMAGALAQTADRVESLPTDAPDYTAGVPLESGHGLWRQPEPTTVEPSTSQSDKATDGVAMTTSTLTNQEQVAPFSCEVNLLDHICEMQDDVEKRLEMMEQHIIALETACEAPATTQEGQDPLHDRSKVKGEIRRLLSDLNKKKSSGMFLRRSCAYFWILGEEIAGFLTWWILEKTRKWRPKEGGVVVGRAEFSQVCQLCKCSCPDEIRLVMAEAPGDQIQEYQASCDDSCLNLTKLDWTGPDQVTPEDSRRIS
ncbi:hypothetical protein Bbelb_164600, partial [Branchiostoma belcheri]